MYEHEYMCMRSRELLESEEERVGKVGKGR